MCSYIVLLRHFQAHISCALSPSHLPRVLLFYGFTFSLGSILVTLLLQHVKRYALVTMATLFELGNLLVLFGWVPHPSDVTLFYVLAVGMASVDAIWQSLVNGKDN